MIDKQETRLRELAPKDELALLIREANQSVEDELALEDAGWVNLSGTSTDVITPEDRITNLKLSRLYATKDPLGKQAIRLWTDYTFGTGMTSHSDEEKTEKVRKAFWDAKVNRKILGSVGQRKSSNKLLVDGEVYFALFLGANGLATIRRIDPLEIKEIITDPDDKENERYYRRLWTDSQGTSHDKIYRSTDNIKDEAVPDINGNSIQKTDDALVYRLEYNDRNPLLLPALVWMKYNTKFLSSRIAIMLALAKFAWKGKVKGGQTMVDAMKNIVQDQEVAAGSTLYENLGIDTTPIKTETGASSAYQDGRMIKLMIFSAVGISEQYFADISTGNLATAKTVELPMTKMFQSYQQVWADTYQDIDEIVFNYNQIAPDKQYVDRDFPAIAPVDYVAMADSIQKILQALPGLGAAPDVQQQALLSIGVNDPGEVLDALTKEAIKNPDIALTKLLKQFKESLNKKET